MSKNPVKIGNLLKHYISYNGVTQRYIAGILDVEPSNLSSIVAGKQKPGGQLTLRILSLVLPEPYKELLGRAEAEAECFIQRKANSNGR